MEFIIGKNGTKMKVDKKEKEFLKEITSKVKKSHGRKDRKR